MSAASLTPLPWDSQLFGLPVARLVSTGLDQAAIAALLTVARAQGIRLLYWLAEPTDTVTAAAAAAARARLLDRKATFVQPLADDAAPELPAADVHEAARVTPALLALARQSGAHSRFRLDAQLPPGAFEQLYDNWLRNSLRGELARLVLTTRSADGPETGLLTLGLKDGRADIGLLAVDAAARGQGLGRRLVGEARRHARRWGCQEWQVVTQLANAGACRFYEQCGFRLARVEHVYHLWLPARGSGDGVTFAAE